MVSERPTRTMRSARAATGAGWMRHPHSAERRLADASTDLFLPDAYRLTDRVRASVSTMLDGVVSAIERPLREGIAPGFADRPDLFASLTSPSVAIAFPLLCDARTLRDPALVAILLRRAGEFVLSQRLSPDDAAPGHGLPTDHPDQGVARAATALLVAEGRRIDRFGEAALLLDDLPAELAHRLVWQVAAALRHYLCLHHDVPEAQADALLAPAAAQVLAGHDEGRGLAATAHAFAAKLAAAGAIDGEMLADLLGDGQVSAFVATLALAAAVPSDEVWNVLAEASGGRLATLLKAAAIDRNAAGAILLLIGGMEAEDEIDAFDACGQDEARAAIAHLSLPPDYRDAVASLGDALADPDGAA